MKTTTRCFLLLPLLSNSSWHCQAFAINNHPRPFKSFLAKPSSTDLLTTTTTQQQQQRTRRRYKTTATTPPLTTTTTTTTALKSTITASSSPETAVLIWATGHVIGGLLAVPFVSKACKTWYRKIDLPSWTPPDRLFAPVWTLLYASMGVAAARVYQRTTTTAAAAAASSTSLSGITNSGVMVLWAIHYLLNLTWAPVFFGLKRLRLGSVINYLMLATLSVLIPLFYRNNAISGLLLLPYLAWLLVATALNNAVCRRNPTDKNGYNEAMFQSELLGLQKKAADYAGVTWLL